MQSSDSRGRMVRILMTGTTLNALVKGDVLAAEVELRRELERALGPFVAAALANEDILREVLRELEEERNANEESECQDGKNAERQG